MQLRVTNRNNFTLNDRFDGIDYKFDPNVPVVIEEDAARHIFGYGLIDKLPNLVRLGWAISSDRIEEATAKLNKFVFEQGDLEFKSAEPLSIVDDAPVDEVPSGFAMPEDASTTSKRLGQKVKAAQVSA